MKNKITLLFLILSTMLFTACSEQSGSSPENVLKAELYKLARMNGCIDCHRINATVVGPSWMAIAERYQGAPTDATRTLLIERVNKGSKGNWFTWKGGDGMPPMENRVKPDAVEQLVDYILSLRKPAEQSVQ